MKSKNPITLLIGWLALALAPAGSAPAADGGSPAGAPASGLAAQGGGAIVGRVSNNFTSSFLEGALVELVGTSRSVLTDRDGSFALRQVPAGSQSIRISYTGLDPFLTTVEVGAGATASIEADLTSAVYRMSAFKVSSEREGSALAITQQRIADNVKNVVATDAFGNSANGNVADMLQRLPGIVVDYVAADPRELRIRGVSPELSTVTVDGTYMANAASGSSRTFSFQFMSNMSMLDSVEVNKALTPEMDAASVGGSVNLRSKSALQSRISRQVTFELGATTDTASDNAHRMQPSVSGTFMKTWGTRRRIGLMLNGSYDSYFHIQDQSVMTFQPALTTPTYLTRFGFIDGPKFNYRSSGGARLDFELTKSWTGFLNTNLAYYRGELNSRVADVTTRAEVAQVVNGAFVGRGTVLPDYTEYVTEARATADSATSLTQTNNWVVSRSFLVQPGAKHKLDGWEIDYDGSFSKARHKADRNGDRGTVVASLPGVGWRVDRSRNLDYPEFRFTGGPDPRDLDNYSGLTLTSGQTFTRDEIYTGQLNVKKSIPGRFPVELKAGTRYVERVRQLSADMFTYSYVGPDGIAGVNPATGTSDDRIGAFRETDYWRDPSAGGYRSPVWLSVREVSKRFAAEPGQFVRATYNNVRDTLRTTRSADEEVYAGYVQGRVAFGRLSLLTGVRTERTELEGKGSLQSPLRNLITDPVTGQLRPETVAEATLRIRNETPAERTARTAAEAARRVADPAGSAIEEWGARNVVSGGYRNYFPSAHLRYAWTRDLILRASWATGIGRPNFTNIMPLESVNYTTSTVTASNPNLKPQFVDNYDLSLEYYFEPVGSLSFGWFKKDIKDFIFSSGGEFILAGADNGFGGLYEGFSLVTPRNGGVARIKGYEISYQQRYTFLPGLLKGLGAYANYTRIETDGDYGMGGPRSTGTVPGFVPETANLGMSYSYGRFSFRAKWNAKSRQLSAYNDNPAQLRYFAPNRRVDLNLRVKLNRNLDLYADIINLTREATVYERGPLGRIDAYQDNGRRASFGITGRY